jgi:hypothetical protein
MTDPTPPTERRGATVVDPTTNGAEGAPAQTPEGTERRLRFRRALADISARSSSDDLVRWMLIPGSILVFLGFVVMVLGWVGAARTAREIEQIPYLISGGLVGLALVVLGGLLLVSTFWVAVLRKLQAEATDEVQTLQARIAELEAPGPTRATPARRAPRRAPVSQK